MAGNPKQFRPLGRITMLEWSIRTLLAVDEVVSLRVVIPPSFAESQIGIAHELLDLVTVIPGGATRADSVAAGIDGLETEFVLVHDAARPFASPRLADGVVAALRSGERAVAPGVPAVDTFKRVDEGHVIETLDRDGLVAIQTPQGFETALLIQLHRSRAKTMAPTDDAFLFESAGVPIAVVPGEALNFKVTVDDDFVIAEALVSAGRVSPVEIQVGAGG